MIILGIDPGTIKTGFGVITQEHNKCKFLACGVIKTDAKAELADRLVHIFNELKEIVIKWNPALVCIEDIFVNENIRSALLLGHARGASICAVSSCPDAKILEYSTREIKKAVVGNGGATKDQVNMMVKMILNIKQEIKEDAADALAAAICAANSSSFTRKIEAATLKEKRAL